MPSPWIDDVGLLPPEGNQPIGEPVAVNDHVHDDDHVREDVDVDVVVTATATATK